MLALLRRLALGVVAGAVGGAFAFETISALFFGAGQYSSAQLGVGAAMGAVVGAVFGPLQAALRATYARAILLQVPVCVVGALLFQLSMVRSGTVFASVASAVTTVITATLFIVLATTLCAVATVYLLRFVEERWPRDEAGLRASRAPRAGGRYRL